MNPIRLEDLKKITDNIFEIPQSFRPDMRVPARVFATELMLKEIIRDRSLEQLVNVATLPGIQKYALAMPDIHQGYGFPIGGVAAMAIDNGVVSPGGIGYDINCGVRLLVSNLTYAEVKPHIEALATALFKAIPSGVGKAGYLKITAHELDEVLTQGIDWMIQRGYGLPEDKEHCEEHGNMAGADPSKVSDRAKERGHDQLGTLGSGNHFLEVQRVADIFDPIMAKVFNLQHDQVTVMIHCGSRGLGHQVCSDYVRLMIPKLKEWGITLPDRELACAPCTSIEGQEYLSAMAAAANFAWANRHLIAHNVRVAWQEILGSSSSLQLLYDVAHNIGKRETHTIDGKEVPVIMHRKGATRAFPPHHPGIPAIYQEVGQPVLIPGTMGTSSYVLAGTAQGMEVSFGSSCHGAGRRLSRMEAKKTFRGSTLRQTLEESGIVVRSVSNVGLAEEAPEAYKDVDDVVNVVSSAGIAHKVARLVPIAIIKG